MGKSDGKGAFPPFAKYKKRGGERTLSFFLPWTKVLEKKATIEENPSASRSSCRALVGLIPCSCQCSETSVSLWFMRNPNSQLQWGKTPKYASLSSSTVVGTGDMHMYVGDKGKGSEVIHLGEVMEAIGKSKELGAVDITDRGFETGDKHMYKGDKGKGLDVIQLGDTDYSSDDTVNCQGDMYQGLEVISTSSQEEDEDEDVA